MSGTKKQSKKEMAREEEEQVEEEQQQEEQVSYPPVASVVASIFKTISLDETDIERHRQELANVRDFDSRNLYDKLNANGDSKVTADELCAYMTDNFVKGATIENCGEIIAEYDSSGDGSLQYEEFLNMVLPAANQGLRDYCLYGRRVYLHPSRPLPLEITHAAVRIFEKEKQLIERKKELQLQLASNPDYSRQDAFNEASKGQTFISTYGLTQYLERNGFYPRESDLEAILRRCDHSGDKELSYTEFCEAIEVLIPGQSSENQEEEGNGPSDSKVEGESKPDSRPHWQIVEDERRSAEDARRKQWMQDEEDRRQRLLQEAEERRTAEESRREQDRKDFEARVEAERQRREAELEAERIKRDDQRKEWEAAQEKRRQEDEARIQAQKEENQSRYEMISKVVAWLQDRITEAATLDLQKEMLAYHGSFDSLEVFKQLDSDNNGYVTSQEFQNYFQDDEDVRESRFDLLINWWNRGNGDRLTYNQMKDGLACAESNGGYGQPRYPRSRDEGQQSVQDNSWRQQLKFVIYLQEKCAVKAFRQSEQTQDMNGENVQVDREQHPLTSQQAASLWSHIDNYNDGSVTAQQVQRWLEEEAQFTVPPNRTHFIEDAFDTVKRDGRISQKEWMAVLAEDEEGQNEEEMQENGDEEYEGQEDGDEYEEHGNHSEPEQR